MVVDYQFPHAHGMVINALSILTDRLWSPPLGPRTYHKQGVSMLTQATKLSQSIKFCLFKGSIMISAPLLLISAPAIAAKSKQSVLQEITVTAQKREQNVQDVSVAVSAFSGDAVEKMGFEEGLDITLQVPNMSFFAIFGEASSPSISLRGISLVNFSDSWESPVSIYVDDVYRGNPAGSAIQLFDIERIEVLRGPQGTLYGRNTTGGLVHYVSKKPSDEVDGYAKAGVGSYSEVIVEGAFGGPITNNLNGRLSLKANKNDGWQTNVITGDKLNDTDSLGYRFQLSFEPSAHADFNLSIHGSEADQQSVGFAHMGYLESPEADSALCSINDIQNGLCTSVTLGDPEGSTPYLTGASQVNGQYDPEHVASGASNGLATKIDTFGTSLTANIDIGQTTLTSVTAYETLDKFLQDDGDGTERVWFDEQYSADAKQFTQELRLAGSGDFGKWVTGIYYYQDERDLITQAPTSADIEILGLYHEELVFLESESTAVFGQVEYDLNSYITAVIGARYTEESRDFKQESDVSFFQSEVNTERDLSDDAFTGKLGLDFRPDSETLAYISLSTGFKSGGFSGSYNGNEQATDPVGSETINNLELGYKRSFADGKIRLNAAAFTYEIKDYQAQVFLVVADGSVVTNAGDVRGQGIELEVNSLLTDNFELITGFGLLDSEFESDQVFEVATQTYSLDKNELPSAPSLTYNFVARYYIPTNNMGEFALQADYSWQDDHYLQIENDPFSEQDAYGLLNAKISWQSDAGNLTASIFGNNLSNEEYFTYQNSLGDDWGYGVWGKPRTMGASVKWSI